MASTNLELYEELKKTLTESAARMIAEVVPTTADIATKADIMNLDIATKADIVNLEKATKADIVNLEKATRASIVSLEKATRASIVSLEKATTADIARLGIQMAEMEVRLLRRTLTFFLPLWIAVLAALVTVILQA